MPDRTVAAIATIQAKKKTSSAAVLTAAFRNQTTEGVLRFLESANAFP